MKTNFILLFVFLFFLSSCKDENLINEPVNSKGTVKLSYQAGLQKTSAIDDIRYAVVTVENQSETVIYTQQKIEMFKMSGTFISAPLSFDVGDNYNLTEFLLLDKNSNILYISPKEGSEKAMLVDDPLNISFNILKDQTTHVVPEVLEAEGSASDFGYATFGFQVVNTFKFMTQTFKFDLFQQQLVPTKSSVLIKNAADTLYAGELSDSIKTIYMADNFDTCEVTVSKQGFNSIVKQYTKTELESFSSVPLTLTFQTPSGLPTVGLVGEWLFNGNANETTGLNNTGTLSGTNPTTNRKGVSNKALYFDGNDDEITVADHNNLSHKNQEFTISYWMEPNDATQRGLQFIYYKGLHDYSSGEYGSFIYDEGNYLQSYILNNGLDYTNNVKWSGSPIIEWNKWQHVCWVWNKNKIEVYIDGKLMKTTNINGVMANTATDLHIGNKSGYFYKGKLDDFRIYNRALSEDEVIQLYFE